MSKKSKKHHNGNHNQNTPQPVRIMPEHQSQTEANPKPARRWFPRIRAYVADCVQAFKRGYQEGRRQARTVYETAKVEAVASVGRIAESAKPRVARGRRMAQVDPRSPSLRVAGAALVVAAVWGPLGWLALVIGILLLVRPAVVPRLAADGLAWAMAGAEEADRLLARAWAAISAKWKVATASVMVTATLFWAKVRSRMTAPVLEAEPAC
ncbi:MAG: hypothetical protein RBS80_18155 [Thermoguttaceae bacterium]|jgi:hypothetical protein|nr:hypothetical protein [Thermoguttaceae bacterium]